MCFVCCFCIFRLHRFIIQNLSHMIGLCWVTEVHPSVLYMIRTCNDFHSPLKKKWLWILFLLLRHDYRHFLHFAVAFSTVLSSLEGREVSDTTSHSSRLSPIPLHLLQATLRIRRCLKTLFLQIFFDFIQSRRQPRPSRRTAGALGVVFLIRVLSCKG